MTTIGSSPISRAFFSTNRVCGIGPSAASTSRMHAVDHGQDALDLAAEVCVAGRVDDVDLHFGRMDELRRQVVPGGRVRRLVVDGMAQGIGVIDDVTDRGVLGEDGDAALTLQVVRVHDPLVHLLVGANDARLLEEGVDEGGLAMVDVRDDGDVADVVAKLLHARALTREARWNSSLGESRKRLRGQRAARSPGKPRIRTLSGAIRKITR